MLRQGSVMIPSGEAAVRDRGNPGDESEEDQHRRSRLWLGYSTSTLGSSLNAFGNQQIGSSDPNQDISKVNEPKPKQHGETSKPTPTPRRPDDRSEEDFTIPSDFSKARRSRFPDSQRREEEYHIKNDESKDHHGAVAKDEIEPVHAPQRTVEGSQEDYTIPDDFPNLDEIRAPSPIENPQIDREQGYLENRKSRSGADGDRSDSGEFDNLDEVAAPSPIIHKQRDRHKAYLEDATASSPLSEEKPPSTSHSGKQQRASNLESQIYTISHLIFFSIFGTLARLGLQALTFYPGAPVQTGLLWANVGGSLIMGFLSEDKNLFRMKQASPQRDHLDEEKPNPHPTTYKKTLPLYIGLTTGFCGSFTSFSSFMRDTFFALSNALPVPIQHPSSAPISQNINVPRNPGYSFLAILAVLILTIGLSLLALQFGAHIALFLAPYTPSLPSLSSRKTLDRTVVLLAFGCWLAAMIMAIVPPDRPGGPIGNALIRPETWRSQALFALVLAPLGCLLRFYLSLSLNPLLATFPLGTFTANMLGTALEATFLDLQRVPVGGLVGCQVLQGMEDGFCGCLTTVSTWVVELNGLRLRHAYLYGAVSVGIGLVLMIVITGSLQWTRGFAQPLCVS